MDNKAVYEKFDWASFTEDDLGEKISKVIEMIPEDVENILDVGCGNGLITNTLGEGYDVTGVDRSENALKFVKTNKIQADADHIPLADQSFDLVFSSELLEHLDDKTITGTISEIKRLSKKYIFITVPNDENPDKLAIKCPSCSYVYNRPNHLRSFKLKKFESLFPEYRIIKHFVSGKKVRYYQPALLNLKKRIAPSQSWIPYYWIPESNRKTICPNCEHEFKYDYRFNVFATSIDIINAIISPKKPYWLFVLMEKK